MRILWQATMAPTGKGTLSHLLQVEVTKAGVSVTIP